MSIALEPIAAPGHEEVVRIRDDDVGLHAIVAVHSTALGRALGGTRFHPFPDERAALDDVLRLAAAMTRKNAVAGLDHGGGKAVIMGDPATDKTPELFHAYGRGLARLEGRYLTAEDVGTTPDDMDVIAETCPYVTGASDASGDPSIATAVGLRGALRAVAVRRFGPEGLAGRQVVISGVGKVGSLLAGRLVADGARVTVADVDDDAVARVRAAHGVVTVDPDEVWTTPCDVLAPCALGGVLTAGRAPGLRGRVVGGAANNQLADDAVADALAAADVLYLPDYVVNGGGVINLAHEFAPGGYDRAAAFADVEQIAMTVLSILDEAAARGITPFAAAEARARRRVERAQGTRTSLPNTSSAARRS